MHLHRNGMRESDTALNNTLTTVYFDLIITKINRTNRLMRPLMLRCWMVLYNVYFFVPKCLVQNERREILLLYLKRENREVSIPKSGRYRRPMLQLLISLCLCVIVLFSSMNHNVISLRFLISFSPLNVAVWQQSMFQWSVVVAVMLARIIGFEMCVCACVVFLSDARKRKTIIHNCTYAIR